MRSAASVTVTTPTWRLWQGSITAQQGTRAIFPEAAEGLGPLGHARR